MRELITQESPALSQRRVRSVDIACDQPSLDITAGELGASVTGCLMMYGWRQDTERRMGGRESGLRPCWPVGTSLRCGPQRLKGPGPKHPGVTQTHL